MRQLICPFCDADYQDDTLGLQLHLVRGCPHCDPAQVEAAYKEECARFAAPRRSTS